MLLPIHAKIQEKAMDETKVQLSKCNLPKKKICPLNELFGKHIWSIKRKRMMK
jgi:hypothetical protein